MVELDHVVRSGEHSLRARGMISRRVHMYMLRHPRGSYIVSPLLSLEVSTPRKLKLFRNRHPTCMNVRTRCGSPPHKWFLVGCSSPFMRLAEHLMAIGARNVYLVGENPTCFVPALWECEGLHPLWSYDYGHGPCMK